ncbi:MAG: STAS domain-containing protein [Chloroflexota bacterium]|nr:STAS domain-containing protein [Chloroflexota bacterium]
MTPINLTILVRKVGARAAVLDVQGDINAQAETVLMNAYAEAVDGGGSMIIINFSGLDYMNSSGIGLLVTLLIRIQRQKQRLLAYGLSDHYRQIFELTRLNEAIGIFADEADALAEGRK